MRKSMLAALLALSACTEGRRTEQVPLRTDTLYKLCLVSAGIQADMVLDTEPETWIVGETRCLTSIWASQCFRNEYLREYGEEDERMLPILKSTEDRVCGRSFRTPRVMRVANQSAPTLGKNR